MKQAYSIIADLHTHTIASTHAYSTFSEMVRAAAERGLYALAVTDHARTMPGAPREWYFSCLHELPLHYRGVMTIAGIEANVLDFEGNLDLEKKMGNVWTGSWRLSIICLWWDWKTRTWKSARIYGCR